ncbi:hypothetical protein SAMN02910398_02383 [Butyrivibrio sp. YAB3001]|nr:hypothetical protein SAMN02910398_02383 [Butyrivibrio sp. YAB3001]
MANREKYHKNFIIEQSCFDSFFDIVNDFIYVKCITLLNSFFKFPVYWAKIKMNYTFWT